MFPEIGHFALILALLVATAQAVLPMIGARRGDAALMAFGRTAAGLQALLITLAFGLLMIAFGRADFSVALVAEHSSLSQPLPYRLAATWGNHEGSMLLWVLVLAIYGAGIARFGDNLRAQPAGARAVGAGDDLRWLSSPSCCSPPTRSRGSTRRRSMARS